MSQLAPCYEREPYYNGQCTIRSGYHEIFGTRSSNPDKCITVLLPTDCIPLGDDSKQFPKEKYVKAIEFFRRLRNDMCVCNLVLDGETSHLFSAIVAGWEKKDIILRVETIDKQSLANKNAEVNRYMADMGFTETQKFHAVYMDEPQEKGLEISDETRDKLKDYREFVNEVLETRFIITDWSNWFVDYLAEYASYCDEIIDNGYHDKYGEIEYSVSELGSRTFLFSMSKMFPSGIPDEQIDQNKLRTYFRWANELEVTSVWLWFGNYHNCQMFWENLKIACKQAAIFGWAKANEVFVETGKLYCKFSDCSKCAGHDYTEGDYWQEKPIGPTCPQTVYEKDYDQRTQSIANFIYSQFSFR